MAANVLLHLGQGRQENGNGDDDGDLAGKDNAKAGLLAIADWPREVTLAVLLFMLH